MKKKVKQGGNCPNFTLNSSAELDQMVSATIICMANQAKPYQQGLTLQMIKVRDLLRNLRDFVEYREQQEKHLPPQYEDD